jgi:hypothetical protein
LVLLRTPTSQGNEAIDLRNQSLHQRPHGFGEQWLKRAQTTVRRVSADRRQLSDQNLPVPPPISGCHQLLADILIRHSDRFWAPGEDRTLLIIETIQQSPILSHLLPQCDDDLPLAVCSRSCTLNVCNHDFFSES